jgi:hypothetical protein
VYRAREDTAASWAAVIVSGVNGDRFVAVVAVVVGVVEVVMAPSGGLAGNPVTDRRTRRSDLQLTLAPPALRRCHRDQPA